MASEPTENGTSIITYFDSIPEDLILSILNKIGDMESLFRVYFSCSQFAYLVFLVSGPISVHIPSPQIPTQILIDPSSPVWPPGKLEFLGRFHQVESVTIRFSCVDSDAQMPFGHFYRWKCESARFIMLHVKQRLVLSNQDDTSENCNVLSEQELSPAEFAACFDIELVPLSDSDLRVLYIKELLDVLPNLNRVSAEDFVKQGRVIVDEEAIANLRNDGAGMEEAVGEPLAMFTYKAWVAPEVKLPFSEFMLRGMTLICYRLVEAADHIDDIFEENEYSEVAMRIMEEEPTIIQPREMHRFRFVRSDHI